MQVRGVDLEVRESGQGSPFFWGHGLIGSMAQDDDAGLLDWAELARVARLLRYDARGHGRSEATLDPAGYRWPELARDLLALVDACGAERAVLGGVSMGCAGPLVWMASLGRLAPGSSPVAELQRTLTKHLRRADRRAVVAALRGAAASDLPEPAALRALESTAFVLAGSFQPDGTCPARTNLGGPPARHLRIG